MSASNRTLLVIIGLGALTAFLTRHMFARAEQHNAATMIRGTLFFHLPDSHQLLQIRGGQRLMPAFEDGIVDAAWSPNNRQLLLVTSDSIILRELYSKSQRTIIAHPATEIRWSLDGTHFSYVTDAGLFISDLFGHQQLVYARVRGLYTPTNGPFSISNVPGAIEHTRWISSTELYFDARVGKMPETLNGELEASSNATLKATLDATGNARVEPVSQQPSEHDVASPRDDCVAQSLCYPTSHQPMEVSCGATGPHAAITYRLPVTCDHVFESRIDSPRRVIVMIVRTDHILGDSIDIAIENLSSGRYRIVWPRLSTPGRALPRFLGWRLN